MVEWMQEIQKMDEWPNGLMDARIQEMDERMNGCEKYKKIMNG